jgi:hypothetical protein
VTLLVCLLYFSAVNIKRSDDTATGPVHRAPAHDNVSQIIRELLLTKPAKLTCCVGSHVNTRPPLLDRLPSQLNAVQAFTLQFSKMCFNIILLSLWERQANRISTGYYRLASADLHLPLIDTLNIFSCLYRIHNQVHRGSDFNMTV